MDQDKLLWASMSDLSPISASAVDGPVLQATWPKRVDPDRFASFLQQHLAPNRELAEKLADLEAKKIEKFSELFNALDFVPKILEHVGGIARFGKKFDDSYGVGKAFSDLGFNKQEISFPHYYPRTRMNGKLFECRSDTPRAPFSFTKAQRPLYNSVIKFFKQQGFEEEDLTIGNLPKIFEAAGWKLRDPHAIWLWELFANVDQLTRYGIFIDPKKRTFSFAEDVGTYKEWSNAKLNLLIGNDVKSTDLQHFLSSERAIKILEIDSKIDSANHKIGSTVQLQQFLKYLGLKEKELSSEQKLRYERRMEFLRNQAR